jgi:hypothetical protein
MSDGPPDVALVGPEWPSRALLRAQLVEDGYSVVATDTWPIPRQYLRRGMKPRLVVVDLHGLPDPDTVLDELGVVLAPDRGLVVTALGSLEADQVRHRGFHVVPRPTTVGEIVAAVARLLRTHPDAEQP